MVQVARQPDISNAEQRLSTASSHAPDADSEATLVSFQGAATSLADWLPAEEKTASDFGLIDVQTPQYSDVVVTAGQRDTTQILNAAHQWVAFGLLGPKDPQLLNADSVRYDSVAKILVAANVSEPQVRLLQQGGNWIALRELAADDSKPQVQPMDETTTSATGGLTEHRPVQRNAMLPAIIGGGFLGLAVLSLGLTAVLAAIELWPYTVVCLFVAITTTLLGLVELARK